MTPSTPDEQSPPSVEEILAADHRWYHTIELSAGTVTPGWIDLRGVVGVAGIPADLRGRRVLDVGMFDGFWAFEMERRGAAVVGVDTDEIPPPDTPRLHRERVLQEVGGATTGIGFALLKRWFGSSVERLVLDVYDVRPEMVGGPVDLAFVGSLLLHLRDPVRALERVRETLVPGGVVICFEPIDHGLSRRRQPTARYLAFDTPWTWWYPNLACLVHWLRTAGFDEVDVRGRAWVRGGDAQRQELAAVHARR